MFYAPLKGKLICDGKPLYLATTGRKIFQLLDWWEYQDNQGQHWVVPKSFVCDLASVPSCVFWWQFGAWNISAIAHDWAYVFGYLLTVEKGKLIEVNVTKKEADRLFADVNFTLGVPNWVNRLMFFAVRLFGRGVWSKLTRPEYGKTLLQLQEEYDQR